MTKGTGSTLHVSGLSKIFFNTQGGIAGGVSGEVGKFADFIVLDRNFMEIDAEDLGKARVLRTVVGGEIVYDGSGLD